MVLNVRAVSSRRQAHGVHEFSSDEESSPAKNAPRGLSGCLLYRHKQLPVGDNQQPAGDTTVTAPSAETTAGEQAACKQEGIDQKQPSSEIDEASEILSDTSKMPPLKAGPPVQILDSSQVQAMSHAPILTLQGLQPSQVPQTILNTQPVPQQSAQTSVTNTIQVPIYSGDIHKMTSLTETGTVTYGPMMHSLFSVLPPSTTQSERAQSGHTVVVTQSTSHNASEQSQEHHMPGSHYNSTSI